MKTKKKISASKIGMRLRDYFRRAGGSMHPAWNSFFKSTGGRGARVYLDLEWVPESLEESSQKPTKTKK